MDMLQRVETWARGGERQVTVVWLAGGCQRRVHIEVWALRPGALPGFALIAEAWGEDFAAAADQIDAQLG